MPRDVSRALLTACRKRTDARTIYVILLCAFGAALPVLDFSLIPPWKRDFLNYWLGPRAWWAGINPYDLEAYRDFGLTHFAAANPQQFNFTYPPHSLLLFAPFAALPGWAAFVAWDALSLAVFYLAARPWLPRGFPSFVALLTPATLICLQFGQTGLFSAALFLWAFRGNGLAAAILTFKPHVGFFAAPALFLAGRRPFLITVVVMLLLILVSAFVFGGWGDFLDHLFGFQGRSLAEKSVISWVLLGTTPMIGYGLVGLAVYGIPALVILCRNFNVFTAATATFLISPYGFHYDMAAVCLGFAVLLYSYWDEMPAWHKLFSTLGYLTPVIVGFGAWWVPPVLIVGLYVQTRWLPGVRLIVESNRLKTATA